jgi:hypothetical protein
MAGPVSIYIPIVLDYDIINSSYTNVNQHNSFYYKNDYISNLYFPILPTTISPLNSSTVVTNTDIKTIITGLNTSTPLNVSYKPTIQKSDVDMTTLNTLIPLYNKPNSDIRITVIGNPIIMRDSQQIPLDQELIKQIALPVPRVIFPFRQGITNDINHARLPVDIVKNVVLAINKIVTVAPYIQAIAPNPVFNLLTAVKNSLGTSIAAASNIFGNFSTLMSAAFVPFKVFKLVNAIAACNNK